MNSGTPQISPDILALLFGLVAVILLVVLAIHIVICLVLYRCFQSVPQEFRKQEPGLVWLLMIPCFPLIWNFFVYPKLADSYLAYFTAIGRTDVGDCGRSIGLAYAICVACSIVPYVNTLTGLASLVLLIIFLIKAWDLKSQIQIPPVREPVAKV